MENQDAINLGFKPIGHFTVGNSHIYDLGRNRQLSFSGIGTCNEFLYIGELKKDGLGYEDLICIHNYDYDGFMTVERLNLLIKYFANN